MFREMRRNKQQLSEEETLAILAAGTTAILGVAGDDGYPYTVPVNYVYTDNKVYIHGAKSGHKLDAIRQCAKVSLCVIGMDNVHKETLTTHFKSVVAFGKARILENDEDIFHAAEVLGLKYNDDKAFIDAEIQRTWNALCCIEIAIEHITGKECIELTRMREQ